MCMNGYCSFSTRQQSIGGQIGIIETEYADGVIMPVAGIPMKGSVLMITFSELTQICNNALRCDNSCYLHLFSTTPTDYWQQ